MAENGYGPAPVAGHYGRIPNYGKTHVNPMGNVEPPACIQNAMMTKDKKPFTYTPGGLDLSQIKTPSMARRMARQRSLEEQEQANAGYHHQGGGAMPPPPPPPQAPAPPPPPPLVIQAPTSKSPKTVLGERPEIVIPEDPIRMLRKTNSPYHWEAEKAEMQKMGPVPRFQDKVPSPVTVQMAPSSFSQQPPQTYAPPAQNHFQRQQEYPYGGGNQNKAPESPIHRPEAQYAHQKTASPNVQGSQVSREALQRQDSQFNKSPQPFGGQSPVSNGSPFSPTPNNNWRQPERRDSPAHVTSPHSPPVVNRNQFSPNVQQFSPNYQNQPIYQNQQNQQNQQIYQNQQDYQNQQNKSNYQSPPATSTPAAFHTLPRVGARVPDNYTNNNVQNNVHNNTKEAPLSPKNDASNYTPWRNNTINRNPHTEDLQNLYHNSPPSNQQSLYTPPWATTNAANNKQESANVPQWKQDNRNNGQINNQKQQYNQQDVNNNRTQDVYGSLNDKRTQNTQPAEQPRYQSTMAIPVTPRKQNPPQPEQNNNVQKEVVYVNQEPVYFCPESPKSIPPWVKSQKEKTKTPPPEWVQRPLERKSAPRELYTPPRDTTNQEPEWVKKSNEMQRNLREVISPPKHQQPVQPTWSTRPSDNRKSLPKDNVPSQGSRVIPVQIESDHGNQAPTLRIMINTHSPVQGQGQPPLSQPTQRIMRVLSPSLVRMDEPEPELPSLNRSLQSNMESQAKTRIIPIQIEGAGNGGANKGVYYHKFTHDAPPRQSKAFRVLQIITGTHDEDHVHSMEENHGFSDL